MCLGKRRDRTSYITSTSGALKAPCPQPADLLDPPCSAEIQAKGNRRRLEICTPKAQSEGAAHMNRCPAGAWAEGLPRSSRLCRKTEVPREADFCICFCFLLFCLLDPSCSEWRQGTTRNPGGAEATLPPAGSVWGDFCPGDRGPCLALQQHHKEAGPSSPGSAASQRSPGMKKRFPHSYRLQALPPPRPGPRYPEE